MPRQIHRNATTRASSASLRERRLPTIAVLGGSVSFGVSVDRREAFPSALARLLPARVLNLAVPGSGASQPSFCLDQLLAASRADGNARTEISSPVHVDAFILEFAINEAGAVLGMREAESTSEGKRVEPLASVERLIRRIRRSHPASVPVILDVCAPKVFVRRYWLCNSLFDRLAKHYSILRLSLRSDFHRSLQLSDPWPAGSLRTPPGAQPSLKRRLYPVGGNETFDAVRWIGPHPDPFGHMAAARILTHALRPLLSVPRGDRKRRAAGTLRVGLPPPLFLDEAAEHPDRPWDCQACAFSSEAARRTFVEIRPPADGDVPRCEGLHPLAVAGFVVHAGSGLSASTTAGTAGTLAKIGWLGRQRGDHIAFAVPLPSGAVRQEPARPLSEGQAVRVLLAMLCSYENVGAADVWLQWRDSKRRDDMSSSARRGPADDVGNGPWDAIVHANDRTVDLRWSSHTSQLCLVDLGTMRGGADSHPARLELHVRVTSSAQGQGRDARGLNQVKIYGVYSQLV